MASLAFKQVDVFTERPFFGNPVAVVFGGEALETADMQRIANWTNLSETTFVLEPTAPGADYRLRIFTPRQELAFAGHPTIGSAHAALESGFVKRKAKLIQECGAGLLELNVEDEVIMVRGPAARISDVRRTLPFARKLLRVDLGPVWVVGEVADTQALAALEPDLSALVQFSLDHEATGVTLFAHAVERDCALHVRSFAPAHGIAEDPVCGSGNLGVAAYLQHTGALERVGYRYVARQGMQLGRDGRVSVRIAADGIRIGGRSVTCIDGTLRS